MEIGVRVEAEKRTSMERKHIVSAYFTFVALDEQQRPTPVPSVTPETEKEKRRYQESEIRRNNRIAQHTEIQKKRGK